MTELTIKSNAECRLCRLKLSKSGESIRLKQQILLCNSLKICILLTTYILIGNIVSTTQESQPPLSTSISSIVNDNFNSSLFALRAEKLTAGDDLMFAEAKNSLSFAEGGRNSTRKSAANKHRKSNNKSSSGNSNRTLLFDDEQASDSSDSNEIFDEVDGSAGTAGSQKEPDCASHGRYYCTYKEEYPMKLVTEVTKYYKWPLEKLFRDLHAQIMPKLAHDSTGNLVCDSVTRVVRPGWARNTNERWLVVINNDNYHQYVTEVVCQYGSNSRCNFIPPCYYSSCQQRYNTQKLLVIDPNNPYRGPFLSEFLFPSCCVCYVPSTSDSLQDKYRTAPTTIYQRTLQQESANNLYPPQFKPPGLLEDNNQRSLGSASASAAAQVEALMASSPAGGQGVAIGNHHAGSNQDLLSAPGEIRRAGEHYKRPKSTSTSAEVQSRRENNASGDFPRL